MPRRRARRPIMNATALRALEKCRHTLRTVLIASDRADRGVGTAVEENPLAWASIRGGPTVQTKGMTIRQPVAALKSATRWAGGSCTASSEQLVSSARSLRSGRFAAVSCIPVEPAVRHGGIKWEGEVGQIVRRRPEDGSTNTCWDLCVGGEVVGWTVKAGGMPVDRKLASCCKVVAELHAARGKK